MTFVQVRRDEEYEHRRELLSPGHPRRIAGARGIDDGHLTKGARRSTLDEPTDWTVWADTVVTF